MNIAYTICSANYLPYAKTLADSFVEHNRDSLFIIALLDTYSNIDAAFFAPHQIIPVADMAIRELDDLNSSYDIFELSCALKPFVAEYILTAYSQSSVVFYFDADIQVFGSLENATAILQHHPLLLTPHVSCAPKDISTVNLELGLLRTGLYNAGFFGVNRSATTFHFLSWWKGRLKDYCVNDAEHGLFVDQLWLNLAPVYFRETFVLHDAGYNVAYWNFEERKLTFNDEQIRVNENEQLVFFHFSGYDFSMPHTLSKHKKDYTFDSHRSYAPLFENYKTLVLKNNAADYFSLPVTMGKRAKVKRKKWYASLLGRSKKGA
jgi:hypothetical protein